MAAPSLEIGSSAAPSGCNAPLSFSHPRIRRTPDARTALNRHHAPPIYARETNAVPEGEGNMEIVSVLVVVTGALVLAHFGAIVQTRLARVYVTRK